MNTPLRWTRTTPTAPDFYWARNGATLWVSEVYEDGDGVLRVRDGTPDDCDSRLAEYWGCEWAGPLPRPEESTLPSP